MLSRLRHIAEMNFGVRVKRHTGNEPHDAIAIAYRWKQVEKGGGIGGNPRNLFLVASFVPSPRAAFARFVLLMVPLFLVEGCLWRAGKARVPTGVAASSQAPASIEIGRILAFNPETGTALVEIPAHLALRTDLVGRSLVIRNLVSLAPTAHAVVSPHRAGRILGVYVIDGVPLVEDEVVLNPLP